MPLSSISGYAQSFVNAIAANYLGDTWYLGSAGPSIPGLNELDPSGNSLSPVPPLVQASGTALSVDGLNRVWLGYGTHLAEAGPAPVGSGNLLISPAGGYTLRSSNGLVAVAIDGSGNVWTVNGSSQITELIGMATPVVTPLSARISTAPQSDARP